MTCAMRTNQDWGVATAPLPHQIAALKKMKPSRVGALFMDMGTGKSLVTIMLAHLRRHKISKVVWCCPVSLKRNTREQILTHTDCLPGQVYLFDDETTDQNIPAAFWYIVGLESIGGSNRVTVTFNGLVDERTMLVVDEASYIKGHRAKRTKRLTLIGQRARYRLVLNGTPISQGLEDLYAQMAFLSEKILGYRSWYSFSRAHLEYSERFKGKIERRTGLDWLSEKIAPYVYQVKKSECLQLPEKTYANRYVNITNAQQKLYDAAKERFADEVMNLESENNDTAIAIYRLFGALQAISNGVIPAGFQGAGESLDNHKIDEVVEVLGRIHESHVVVWVRFRRSVIDLSAALKAEGYTVWNYYGDLSENARAEQLAGWRENGGVLVATESCGGYGLTLTEASYCIFMSNSFKYSERLQAEDRLHRIGQQSNVHYISIWADCGIEERIETALYKKGNGLARFQAEVEKIKGNGKGAIKEFLKGL